MQHLLLPVIVLLPLLGGLPVIKLNDRVMRRRYVTVLLALEVALLLIADWGGQSCTLLTLTDGVRIVLQGIMFAILSLIAYKLGEPLGVKAAQTMAFMVLAMSQTVHAYNMRSDRSMFAIGVFGNKKLNGATLISIAMMALVLFTPVGIAFGLVILPAKLYLYALGLIIVPVVVMELAKLFKLIK